MALTSTIYHFSIELADMDRDVYQSFKVPVAQHPSESAEFMITRLLAYCLEYDEGIAFSRGVGAPEEPTISVKNLDGSIKTWIEIGSPDGDRLHKASKMASRVAVYSHRGADLVLQQLRGGHVFRGDQIPVYTFTRAFIPAIAAAVEKRNEMTVSRSDQTVYVRMNARDESSILSDGLVERP